MYLINEIQLFWITKKKLKNIFKDLQNFTLFDEQTYIYTK